MQYKREKQNVVVYLWRIVGKSKAKIFFLILIQVGLSICTVSFPWMLRGMLDNAVLKKEIIFYKYLFLAISIICIQIIVKFIKRFLEEDTKSNIENQLKQNFFSSLLLKEYSAVAKVHSGEWMNRLTSDTTIVAENMTTIIPEVIGLFVKLIGALYLLFSLIPSFVYLVIPCGLISICFTCILRRNLKELHKDVQELDGKLRIFLTECLNSLLIVRTFAKEDIMMESADEKMKLHKKSRMKKMYFSNTYNTAFSFMMNGMYIAGAFYCGLGIMNETISYGSFLAVLQSITQIQSPFANITGYLPKYYAMIASVERLMELEQYEDAVSKSKKEKEELSNFYKQDFQGIGLQNVTFSYSKQDEQKLLEKVSVFIKKGDYVAITGPSGCGKSTLLKLLMGIYLPDEGKCYLQRKNGEKLEIRNEFIQLFAYVPQGNYLMSGTIREIIAFSNREKMLDEKAIWNALRIACAEEFVAKLPCGIDTELGERGMGLSEGQMQRIAIARAVFSDNPVLILDEITSALDKQTEIKVLNNLKEMTDKTVLFVTHRSNVICDRKIDLTSL